MCNFFSFVTDPVNHPAEYYYFDWGLRQADPHLGRDSHSHICFHFRLDEDRCNKYEYNPFTGRFMVDRIYSKRNDRQAAEKWARRLDFKEIIEPLGLNPVVHPLKVSLWAKTPTEEQLMWFEKWSASSTLTEQLIREALNNSGMNIGSFWDLTRREVHELVWKPIFYPITNIVGKPSLDLMTKNIYSSIRNFFWAYVTSFFDIDYGYDFSPAINLWNEGFVPSFDGHTWRLHSGNNATVVFEWSQEKEKRGQASKILEIIEPSFVNEMNMATV